MDTKLHEGLLSNGIPECVAIKISAVAKEHCQQVKKETEQLFDEIYKEFPSEREYKYDYESAILIYIIGEIINRDSEITKSRRSKAITRCEDHVV